MSASSIRLKVSCWRKLALISRRRMKLAASPAPAYPRGMRFALRTLRLALALALLGGGPAAAESVSLTQPFGCEELVVVGRVETVSEKELPGDVLGRSRYDMRVRIKRVLHGDPRGRTVLAGGVSHGSMREDVDFWMILMPMNEGAYFIRAAGFARDLERPPPPLARKCG